MNDSQMNRLRMYRKVNGFFKANESKINAYPPIVRSYEKFARLLKEIELVLAKEGGAGGLSGKTKQELKEEMALEASELAASAFVYANDTDNTELANVMNITYSDIRYGDDQSSLSDVRSLLGELTKILPELSDYMISAKDLKQLSQLADSYKQALESTAGQDSVAITKQKTTLFRETSAHLRNNLDKLMLRVQRKESVLYNTYTNARVIVDLGGTKQQSAPEVMEA